MGPAISDFWWYHQAGQAILSGNSPFSVEDFAYPPLFAFLMTPLAALSYEAARWAWFLLSHGFLLGAAFCVWRMAGADRLALLVVMGVWASGGSIAESLMLGQINPLLLFLVALSWWPLQEGLAAGSVAVAAAVKIWPAPLLAAYAAVHKMRAAFQGVFVLAGLFVVPWCLIRLLLAPPWFPPATNYWMGTPALFNFSLPAVVLRVLDPPLDPGRLPHNWEFGNNVHELTVDPSHLWISVFVAASLLAAGIALLLWRAGRNTSLPLASAAMVALSIAASPVSWSHYHLLQYPGVALVLTGLLRQRRMAAAAVLITLFWGTYQLPILGLGSYLENYGWTAGNMALLWALTSLTAVCSLSLFVFYLREVVRGQGSGAQEVSGVR